MFDTLGFNYYIGHIFGASITDGIEWLGAEESKEFFKIIYIKTGPNHFILNDKEFILTGACAICLNEEDRIQFLNLKEDSAKILWFRPSIINNSFNFESMNNPNHGYSITEHQDLHYLRQFLHRTKPSMKIVSLYTIDSSTIEYKLQLIRDLIQNQNTDVWPCRSRSYIFEILFCVSRQEEDERPADHMVTYEGKSRLAYDVIYYLQTCYNQKITIEKLTEEFHTNRTSLLDDFKKLTGQSINSYLIQLRLMMASTMLRDTELPVEEICERTGFSDISYFSKVFKKKLNCTPTEYRRISMR